MTRKLKPIDVPVQGSVADGVLSLPVVLEDGTITTLGETIRKAASLLEVANRAVSENPLCQVAANALMKEQKRRGNPSFTVNHSCEVFLHIGYGKEEVQDANTPLPSLEELRTLAREKNVDISDLGRQKRSIIERLGKIAR
jgi:hypothetical protein